MPTNAVCDRGRLQVHRRLCHGVVRQIQAKGLSQVFRKLPQRRKISGIGRPGGQQAGCACPVQNPSISIETDPGIRLAFCAVLFDEQRRNTIRSPCMPQRAGSVSRRAGSVGIRSGINMSGRVCPRRAGCRRQASIRKEEE